MGVAPPVTVEDVKQAYLTRVKTTHPDVGGNPADFMALQEAFERATEYASFFESRRRWLSNAVERYVAQEEIITEVRRLGGSVATESIGRFMPHITPAEPLTKPSTATPFNGCFTLKNLL